MLFTVLSFASSAAAYQGAGRVVSQSSRIMMQVSAPEVASVDAPPPKAEPAKVAAPAPSAKAKAEEPAPAPLDQHLREMIASKKAVIEAHNADVDASIDYINKLLPKKEVRKLEDLPGANTEVLDGSMPGDAGFDPLRLAETETHLLVYREAEVKHGRLAMLAVAGWVASELVPHGADSLLQTTAGRAPSVLNGGLGEVSGFFWLFLLAIFATVESNTLEYQLDGWQSSGKPWKYVPGDWSFDPLGLQGAIADKWMETVPERDRPLLLDPFEFKANCKANVAKAEVWHGRAAMMAITGFAVQEALWGTPVVDQSPIFFATPVWEALQEVVG